MTSCFRSSHHQPRTRLVQGAVRERGLYPLRPAEAGADPCEHPGGPHREDPCRHAGGGWSSVLFNSFVNDS